MLSFTRALKATAWATTAGAMKVSHAQGFGLVLGGRRVLLGGYSEQLGYNSTAEVFDEPRATRTRDYVSGAFG